MTSVGKLEDADSDPDCLDKSGRCRYPRWISKAAGIWSLGRGTKFDGRPLFHPDFYKVAVSSCGCHDNRMDKIW